MPKVYGASMPPDMPQQAEHVAQVPYRPVGILRGVHTGPVSVVRFTADGNYCMTGGHDRKICLWNPRRAQEDAPHIIVYEGAHGYQVLDLAIAADSASFASCGQDKNVFLWDVKTAVVKQRYWGHTARVNTLAMSADSSILVSGSYDKTVRFFDLKSRSRESLQTLTGFKDSVSSIKLSGPQLITGSVDGTLQMYDIRMGRRVVDHICEPITSVSVSHDDNCILVSSTDGVMRLMDKSSGQLLMEYTGHENKKYKIESIFSNDDAFVLSGSESNEVVMWSLSDAKVVHRLSGHTGAVTGLSMHPKSVVLLTCSVDSTVRVWDNGIAW